MKRILLGAVALGGLAAIGTWQAISQEQAPVEALPADVAAPGLVPSGDVPAESESAATANAASAETPQTVIGKIPEKPISLCSFSTTVF